MYKNHNFAYLNATSFEKETNLKMSYIYIYMNGKNPIRKENPDYVRQFKLTIELGGRTTDASALYFIFNFVSLIIKMSLIKIKET